MEKRAKKKLSRPFPLPKILAIVGPTASGKTALAIKLAKRFGGEIVSADSCQIYRGMDVGTAKPTKEEMRIVPHHLIDIKNPNEDCTVAEYKADAIAAINGIIARKKLPILTGGTGLYVKAVIENLDIPKVAANTTLREKIEQEMKEGGIETVFKKLIALDPEAAYVVDPKNPRRVVRALEVALATGVPFTAQRKKGARIFDAFTIGLNPPPDILRRRINARAEQMIRDGLVAETKQLIEKYGAGCKAFDAVGYREIIGYLSGKASLEETIRQIKTNTWRYAKRQMTWFRKDSSIHWAKNADEAVRLAGNYIKTTPAPRRQFSTTPIYKRLVRRRS